MQKSTISPDHPCKHCGLPVGRHPVGNDPYFCCSGCAIVYETLAETGLKDTFYRLRDVAPDTLRSQPANTRVDALKVSELDTETFLSTHTRLVDASGIRSVELFLDGVHCAACVWLVEQLPFMMEGVVEARLDLPRARLTLQFDPRVVRLSEVAQRLAQFGYIVHPARRGETLRRTTAERRLLMKMGVSWALAGNVMLIAFALYSGLDLTRDTEMATAARWMSMILSLPSVLYGGSEFFSRAWASLKVAVQGRDVRRLHMDTPIALGILVGFGHSTWATIAGRGEIWFDSITVLIAALLTARWLQLRSRRLAGDAAERLLALIPSMARRVDESGTSRIVRIDELQPGDLVEVPAGEVFPADGSVVSGSSRIDNAVLTGESRPEAVEPGDTVRAGATNLSTPLFIRVLATGDDTRIGKLLAWIRNKEGEKAPVVLMADRLSGYFVVTVLFLALVTAVVWFSIAPQEAVHHIVALLVVTCPCALGMATPLAMAVASGRAAHVGIFIKSDEAIQQLTDISAFVLDKTGTLTEGRMALVDFEGSMEAIDLAAALEVKSNHPIARALVEARGGCRLDGQPFDLPEVDKFESFPGKGITGSVENHEVAVGSPDWIASIVHTRPPSFDEALERYISSGHTPVAVAVDGALAAVLAFGDRLRDSSSPIIDHLHALKKDVYLLSGDHPDVVHSIARELKIPETHVLGGASPEDKLAFVEKLIQNGQTVAMIGDGVNDAAALQAASVGIAVQGGSTVSLVAADIFLTRTGLDPVLDLLDSAKRVMHVIRRNLVISLAYNVLGATAAMVGLVTPLVAAIAMPVSSLFVVSSSILQHAFKQKTAAGLILDEKATVKPPEMNTEGTACINVVTESWAETKQNV